MFANPFSNQYPRCQIRVQITRQAEPNPIKLSPIPSIGLSHVTTQMDAMMTPGGLPIVIPPNLAPCSRQLIILNFQVSIPRPFKQHGMLYPDIGHQCHSQGHILFNVVFHHIRRPDIQMLLLTCTQQLCWMVDIPSKFPSPIRPKIGKKYILVELTGMSQGQPWTFDFTFVDLTR